MVEIERSCIISSSLFSCARLLASDDTGENIPRMESLRGGSSWLRKYRSRPMAAAAALRWSNNVDCYELE